MYVEGDVPVMTYGNGYNNNGFGGGWEGLIGLALVAGLFGNGGFGFGFGGNRGGAGSEFLGYELGKVATQADIASGFQNSAQLSGINDLKLGQANMQNWINQGFYGIDRTILQSTNSLSSQLCNCCCETRAAIADLKYSNERQTCDILGAINGSTQRVIDYLQNEKICALQAENTSLKGRISNDMQTAAIVGALSPQPRPAYIVPNPNCCYTTCGTGFGFNGNTVI